jgi:uncharacterized protein with PIN domain
VEVVRRFDLFRSAAPFRRCLRCNHPLEEVDKASVDPRLPPKIRERHSEFRICPACERIYWKGSHYQRLERLIAQALA